MEEFLDISEYLKSLVASLPHSPGVYQYFDEKQNLIYIGKAKDLRKRVSSYFQKNHDSAKTRILVRKITDIKHIVVESESDALLLENNLIKRYKPRYNVLLKDDKTYPWIRVTNEPFPQVFWTRRVVKDGSKYYGPYTSGKMVYTLMEMIRKMYPLRTCRLDLSEENIKKRKFKVCLEYHIGNCKAPCEDKIKTTEYDVFIQNIQKILNGRVGAVMDLLKSDMKQLAEDFRFEEAQAVKERYLQLEQYQSKSTIVSNTITNVDVFSIVDDEQSAFVNFLKVIDGAIIQAHTVEMVKKLDETKEELLPLAIVEIRNLFDSNATEVIIPFDIEFKLTGVKFVVPVRGDKLSLLELSERNAKYHRIEKMKQAEEVDPQKNAKRLLAKVQSDLHLPQMPFHIECFDNSNIQGTNPVAACVVFRDGKPAKKDYRHFNVKTVEGPNDFASMEEIVFRRYRRMLDEEQPLPQLIVIDGGKGQLSAALTSLEKLGLRDKISIVGLAKRMEEVFFPNDEVPMYLNKAGETLKLLQHIRDEAHRFGVTFHRAKRQKNMITSELDQIEGVGEKTKEKMLKHFKSVANIKKAALLELIEVIGDSRAHIVYEFYHGSERGGGFGS